MLEPDKEALDQVLDNLQKINELENQDQASQICYIPEEGKTWETDANVQRHWATHYAEHYHRQLDLNEKLRSENNTLVTQNLELAKQSQEKINQLEAQHAKALQQAQAAHIDAFNQFKVDVIVTLKALELVAIASHRHGQIELSHKVRDSRMSHLKSIIKNALLDFGDRKLNTYDDDF